MPEPFTCPLSQEQVCHPCPVHSCPANLAQHNPEQSCAYILPDLTPAALAETMGTEVATLRAQTTQEANNLRNLLLDFQEIRDYASTNACQNCGYLSPCRSAAVCAERAEISQATLVKINRAGVGLKPLNLWYAVARGLASFLSSSERAALAELLDSKHAKGQL